jgi:hypothetical protein
MGLWRFTRAIFVAHLIHFPGSLEQTSLINSFFSNTRAQASSLTSAMPSSLLFRALMAALALLLTAVSPTHARALAQHERRDTGTITSAGAQVAIGSGTYPRAVTLANGNTIAAYTSTDSDNTIMKVAQYDASGPSWKDIGSVAESNAATTDLANPNLVQLPDGTVLCAFRNHDKNSDGVYTEYRIVSGLLTCCGGTIQWTC